MAAAVLLGLLPPALALGGGGVAHAASPSSTTYTATETIPVPPASSYAGSGGGDGWAVAVSPTDVFNVFHHQETLQVACHLQSDASPCWSPETITDSSGNGFATSGQPGLWYDQATADLYVYATRSSDATGGVVCIDTTLAATNSDPFCGFTALTAVGDAPLNGGISAISDPATVGSNWYAFNYVNGSGVNGTQNQLLCFDEATLAACAGQPFSAAIGSGTVSDIAYPPPAVAAIGTQVIVPVTVGGVDELACFDGSAMSACSGAWPVPLGFSYDSSYGAPFPLLDATGTLTGLCLPSSGDPCFDPFGNPLTSPSGLAGAIPTNSGWNGPGFELGPRVYVPNGDSNEVYCYDASTNAECANFPKVLSNLDLLYTVNPDPQRPTCIWVNSDNGSAQIQNFDAYTGAACGQGPIRVLASSFVVPTAECVPYGYTSLQVQQPAPSTYTNGTVAFEDADADPLNGLADQTLDGTGTTSLVGLNLSSSIGLPQFLITLVGESGTPSSVVVQLTWTGLNDPSCIPSGEGSTSGCDRQYVFVHGIHGNFLQIQDAVKNSDVSGANFASLLNSLSALCPSASGHNIHVFAYQNDLGYAQSSSNTACTSGNSTPDTNVGPLYLDAGTGTTCDGNGALALDATQLDDYLSGIQAQYPGQPITVLANSMGGAITRGWLRLAQSRGSSDTTDATVDSVVFLEGAQQGSIWAGLAELPGGRQIYDLATATPLGSLVSKINLDPNRPGIKDLAPQSNWYNSVNPVAPPSGIAYFNFAANIHINLAVNYFFGQSQLASIGLGDYVMMGGSNDPTSEPLLGGEDFLPGGLNIPNIHQFTLSDSQNASYSIVVGPLNGAVAAGLIAVGSALGGPFGAFVGSLLAIATFMPSPALSDPTDHFNLPSHEGNGDVTVNACDGPGTLTPTAAVLGIVGDPSDACP